MMMSVDTFKGLLARSGTKTRMVKMTTKMGKPLSGDRSASNGPDSLTISQLSMTRMTTMRRR